MKTREEAEQRALDEISKELGYYHWEHFLEDYDTPEKLFHAGVEYAKKAQQKEALIELTEMGEYGNDKLRESAEIVVMTYKNSPIEKPITEAIEQLEKALK